MNEKIQAILDKHYGTVPKSIPAGCNLAILQNGREPNLNPPLLMSGNILSNGTQHWGSVSKQFTAACIIKLVEQKKGFKLSDDIRKYIPELPPFKLEQVTHIATIADLLYMRSGIFEIVTLAGLSGQSDTQLRMEQKIELIAKFPTLLFEPGSCEKYCDTNYYLLAEIVERVGKRPFFEFVRDEIFIPHQMGCRCCVDPCTPTSIQGFNADYTPNDLQCLSYGATGIIGQPSEMAKWNQALDNDELNQLLMPPAKTPTIIGDSVYCRGLHVVKTADFTVIYHNGAIGGFGTIFARYAHNTDPNKTFAYFLTTNIGNLTTLTQAASEIAGALGGPSLPEIYLPPPPPAIPVPITREIATPYEGNYTNLPLGIKYTFEAQPNQNTWFLALTCLKNPTKPQPIIAYAPVKAVGSTIVFQSPAGDTIQLTKDGIVLNGAGVSEFLFTRV